MAEEPGTNQNPFIGAHEQDDSPKDSPTDSPKEVSAASSAAPSRPPSQPPSRPGSAGGDERKPRERHRVRFTSGEALNTKRPHMSRTRSESSSRSRSPALKSPTISLTSPTHSRANSASSLLSERARSPPDIVDTDISKDITDPPTRLVGRPRPPMYRGNSYNSYNSDFDNIVEESHDEEADDEKVFSALSAQERAQRLATLVGSHSAPGSRRTSLDLSGQSSPIPSGPNGLPVRIDDIPLMNLNEKKVDEYDSDDDLPKKTRKRADTAEAHKLVRAHTRKEPSNVLRTERPAPGLRSGASTPIEERDPENYVPPPPQYRGGILSSLLKLYNAPGQGIPGGPGLPPHHYRQTSMETINTITPSSNGSPTESGATSGATTPKRQKWYHKSPNQSTSSLANLIGSSSMLAAPAASAGLDAGYADRLIKSKARRKVNAGGIGSALNRMSRPRLEDEIRITVHIAEILKYMKMTARILEIEGQFLYIPGCMIISFDDPSTHTTEVKLVRTAQGVDLGKLRDTHEVYKEVVHDVIGVEEATQRLDGIMKRKQKNPIWLLVLVYGLASASVGPFAFGARWIDLPIAFILGCLLGVLQLIVAPKSDLYSNVFEISAAVLTSFLARAFGSIRGGDLFCFSALAQSAIALILPGYTVLCGSLELQSRSIVAGSVRMVYAIIYSLFLGFGITIGTAIFGILDPKATSDTKCRTKLPEYYGFFFVPAFTICLCIINQAKWKQIPVMVVISFAGYIVNFFSARRFASNAQIANTLGALAIGVLGNLYSRLQHGVAAAALIPAIFVQVPSGLAATGSLVSGVTSADAITRNVSMANATIGSTTSSSDVNNVVFNVGYSMIQVAIGITVGLFLSALVVYPLGKRRSGLFSF
ncbi:MAG: hypothetical protein M1819_005657 [Sarea resinae]|nr:MAG: hypothetical protein M1819_005657 [Sarea resinae]